MFIDDIHTFVKFLKNQGQNKYHTPEDIDRAVNRASLDLMRQEQKKFEANQMVIDTIGVFKKTYAPLLDGTGLYPLPTDYYRMTNLSGIITSDKLETPDEDENEYCDPDLNSAVAPSPSEVELPMEILTDSEWLDKKIDVVAPITLEKSVAKISGLTGTDLILEVLPVTVKPKIYYLKNPRLAIWAYTISVDTRSFIFDAGSSVDLEWPVSVHSEIIEKTIGYLGIALVEPVLQQYEQFQKRSNNEQ